MYQTLYRKYRPSNFDEVVGQKVIVRTLKNAIKNNKINHAYLFTGPRGTGKTSIAKILARTINCENPLNLNPCDNCVNCTQNKNQSVDIIEIDAASNNGVDEIRELKSKVNLVPSFGKYKIYIIDEVHMLTTGAFNALLKTLEEPPAHIIFVLATTEPHKIPSTILSRCQRFDFKKINEKEIFERMKYIVEIEKIEIEEDALFEIARLSDGGLRDALSLLDQVISYAENKIKIEDVHEINGTITPIQLKEFIQLLEEKKLEKIFNLIDEYDIKGKNFTKLAEELIIFFRNLLLSKMIPDYFEKNNLSKVYADIKIEVQEILKYINLFNKSIKNMKLSNYPKIIFETTLVETIGDSSNLEGPAEKEILVESIKCEQPKEKGKIEIVEVFEQEYKEEPKICVNQNNEKIINQIKLIRINNTLCNFDKKILLDWKNKLKEIETVLIDPNYGELASLLMDGTLKAVGNEYMIFVYENDRLSKIFNENMLLIDEMLEQQYNKSFKVISVNNNEWEIIKKEFNSKIKKYIYQEESEELLDKLKCKEQKNEFENIFGDIIEYEN